MDNNYLTGRISIDFVYDKETDNLFCDPNFESSQDALPADVLNRVYISLGGVIAQMFAKKKYGIQSSEDNDAEVLRQEEKFFKYIKEKEQKEKGDEN